ncbi:MAG: hypothetical protein LAO51_14385 [Acidobacteriia bacterium]|nr:hypothetical protein [Terriglobia bacterium]
MERRFESCVVGSVQVVRILGSTAHDDERLAVPVELAQAPRDPAREGVSALSRLPDYEEALDPSEVGRFDLRGHVGPGNAERGETVIPEGPGIGLAFHEDEVTGRPGFGQAVEAVGNRLALPKQPQGPLFRSQRDSEAASGGGGPIFEAVRDDDAVVAILEAEAPQEVQGDGLVLGQVRNRDGLGRSLNSTGRGRRREQVFDLHGHRAHDRVDRAASEALEQDPTIAALANRQAVAVVIMYGAVRRPTTGVRLHSDKPF